MSVTTRPNLVDRLFLMLDGIHAPATVHTFATLDGAPDPERLVDALEGTLAEAPLLRTVARRRWWGYRRTATSWSREAIRDLITFSRDPREEADSLRRPMELESRPPVRLFVCTTGERTRLVLTLHHSIADGRAGFHCLDRLAAHYQATFSGEPPPPPPAPMPSRSYQGYLWELSGHDRLRAILRTARTFGEIALKSSTQAKALDCATFTDQPLPCRGQLSNRSLTLAPGEVERLKAWARERHATLNDLLLASALATGSVVWPQPEALPLDVMLPVSLRDPGILDIANRVAELPLRFAAADCRTFERAFEAVRATTPVARDRINAVVRICERALMSYLPPRLFRFLAGKHFDLPTNRAMTMVFSNLGVVTPAPRAFGSHAILEASFLGPLSTPPGMGIWLSTVEGRLGLCIGYMEPAVSAESIEAFCRVFRSHLDAILEAQPSRA